MNERHVLLARRVPGYLALTINVLETSRFLLAKIAHHDGADAGRDARTGCDGGSGSFASCTLRVMADKNPREDLRARISEALRGSPAQDLEKNLHALLAAFFDRFDLAAREDLEVHRKLLERAQAKLAALEARVAELEARAGGKRSS
jgi:BMFP domain-containing protein YqiC